MIFVRKSGTPKSNEQRIIVIFIMFPVKIVTYIITRRNFYEKHTFGTLEFTDGLCKGFLLFGFIWGVGRTWGMLQGGMFQLYPIILEFNY